MGLLDQVLGQVIGNMAGGGQARQPAPQQGGGAGDILGQILGGARGGAPQGGAGGLGDLLGQILGGAQGGAAPAGRPPAAGQGGLGDLGGLLGQILGGAQGGAGQAPAPVPAPAPSGAEPGRGGGLGGLGSLLGGSYSPLVLAVLAILANKHLSSGAGGFGSVLHDMLSGGRKPAEAGGGAYGQADEGEDAYGEPPEGAGAPYERPRGGGGGFLDEVGSMLDGPGGAQQAGAQSLLGGGFEDLQRHFDQNGQGGLIDSWIGHGPNREPSPGELEQALGAGAVDQLARQFGLDRSELLAQLSRALPQVVDGLTPHGRAPTDQEQRNWL